MAYRAREQSFQQSKKLKIITVKVEWKIKFQCCESENKSDECIAETLFLQSGPVVCNCCTCNCCWSESESGEERNCTDRSNGPYSLDLIGTIILMQQIILASFTESLKVGNCGVVFLSKSSFMFLLHVNLELAKSSHLFRGGKQLWAQRYQQILATGHLYIGRGKTIQRSFLTIQERDHCIKYSFNFVCIFESSFIPKATIMIYQHRKRFLSIHPNPLI